MGDIIRKKKKKRNNGRLRRVKPIGLNHPLWQPIRATTSSAPKRQRDREKPNGNFRSAFACRPVRVTVNFIVDFTHPPFFYHDATARTSHAHAAFCRDRESLVITSFQYQYGVTLNLVRAHAQLIITFLRS